MNRGLGRSTTSPVGRLPWAQLLCTLLITCSGGAEAASACSCQRVSDTTVQPRRGGVAMFVPSGPYKGMSGLDLVAACCGEARYLILPGDERHPGRLEIVVHKRAHGCDRVSSNDWG